MAAAEDTEATLLWEKKTLPGRPESVYVCFKGISITDAFSRSSKEPTFPFTERSPFWESMVPSLAVKLAESGWKLQSTIIKNCVCFFLFIFLCALLSLFFLLPPFLYLSYLYIPLLFPFCFCFHFFPSFSSSFASSFSYLTLSLPLPLFGSPRGCGSAARVTNSCCACDTLRASVPMRFPKCALQHCQSAVCSVAKSVQRAGEAKTCKGLPFCATSTPTFARSYLSSSVRTRKFLLSFPRFSAMKVELWSPQHPSRQPR